MMEEGEIDEKQKLAMERKAAVQLHPSPSLSSTHTAVAITTTITPTESM